MPENVNINTHKLIHAASRVADSLAAAAIPPAGALPPGLAPSPADLAAAGVDRILRTKIARASTGLADTGPTFNSTAAGAADGLQALDAANAGRIAGVGDRHS